MNLRIVRYETLGLVGLSTLVVAATLGGPLSPPAGPVVSTYKTLGEVEPRIAINAVNTPGNALAVFRITQPGSYVLAGDLTGQPGKIGIAVEADHVSIDLKGFTLSGAMGTLDAIGYPEDPFNHIEVRNGRILNWGGDGIDLGFSTSVTIEDVWVEGVAGMGITTSDLSQVRRCVVAGTGGMGIAVDGDCVVERCTVNGAQAEGISGVHDSAVNNCLVAGCQRSGIVVGERCVVAYNQCASVNGAGIRLLATRNRADGNTCALCEIGFRAESGGNIIVRNGCSGSLGVNWDLAAFNTVGPILSGANAPAVHGNSSAGSGPTDPNANFSY